MENRHRREYARYHRAKAEEETQRSRDLQQQQLESQKQANLVFGDILQQMRVAGTSASSRRSRREEPDAANG